MLHSAGMYLIDASKTPETVRHDICRMPDGVFVDKLSTFTDAAFVSDDSMIVAARHTYVCLWRTCTGLPLRVLQASVSPVRLLRTCDHVNMAVTVLADCSMQVMGIASRVGHIYVHIGDPVFQVSQTLLGLL